MKPDKFRELYSRIDTDVSTDHRIKNRLLYYDHLKESDDRKRYGESYDRSGHSSCVSRLRKLKPILTSLVILMFVAIVLIGIRANLFSKNEIPDHNTTAASGQTSDGSILFPYLEGLLGEDANQPQPEKGSESKSMPNDPADVSPDEITKETEEISEIKPEKITEPDQEEATDIDTKKEKAEEPVVEDFYFAHFDVLTEGSLKSSIPSLVIRLHGNVDSIDPADLSEIVLTRNGIPVDNSITNNYRREQFTWGYEEVTDFYFDFVTKNIEPGNYDLTGKYKGIPFDVYNKILEEALTEEPADSEALNSVGWMYKPDKKDNPMLISELVFSFEGLQNAFYVSDLTDLKATVNGNEIPIAFEERVFRYYEANINNTGDTSFNLIIKEPFTASGTYMITGNYCGMPFTSMELTIP